MQGQLTLNDLAEALYITPSTASCKIEHLVRKELVERRQGPDDLGSCATCAAASR